MRKPEIEYIQFYTDGSAARQPAPRQEPRHRKAAPLTRPRRRRTVEIGIDPIAALGILMAGIMLIFMAVGLVHLHHAVEAKEEMQAYVQVLEERNAQLKKEYSEGYDPEEVRDAALALGMVPRENIQAVDIPVDEPEEEADAFSWSGILARLAELFS